MRHWFQTLLIVKMLSRSLLVSKSPTLFNFLSMVCFHRNLCTHIHCWFYRMASVQYKEHNLWTVSVHLQILFFFLLKSIVEIVFRHLPHRSLWVGIYSRNLSRSLSPAAAGSAVSVKPASDSVTQASVSSMGTLTDSSSGPASLLTTSNQTSLSTLGHSEDLPPSTMPPPQHNK